MTVLIHNVAGDPCSWGAIASGDMKCQNTVGSYKCCQIKDEDEEKDDDNGEKEEEKCSFRDIRCHGGTEIVQVLINNGTESNFHHFSSFFFFMFILFFMFIPFFIFFSPSEFPTLTQFNSWIREKKTSAVQSVSTFELSFLLNFFVFRLGIYPHVNAKKV